MRVIPAYAWGGRYLAQDNICIEGFEYDVKPDEMKDWKCWTELNYDIHQDSLVVTLKRTAAAQSSDEDFNVTACFYTSLFCILTSNDFFSLCKVKQNMLPQNHRRESVSCWS